MTLFISNANITFDNLTPLSNYLGKPGNIELGGIPIAEYEKRQEQHRKAEIAALLDTGYFVSRSQKKFTNMKISYVTAVAQFVR